MFSGEAEIQARRKTLAVLQDEMRRVMDAARDLSLICSLLSEKNTNALGEAVARVTAAENDVEALRRTLTRQLADIGTMMMNREDVLRTAYNIEDVAGYIGGIAFRLSQLRPEVFAKSEVGKTVVEVVDMGVDAVQRLNEIIRALTINSITAIELANGVQQIERKIDEKYRAALTELWKSSSSTKDLIALKDVLEEVDDMADHCLSAADSATILALGL